jgi:hypothetical protein
VVSVFPVLGETATSIQPTDSSFYDPALRLDDEASGGIAAFDDIDRQIGQRVSHAMMKEWSGIGAVGEQLAEERELPEQGRQQQHASAAVLNIGGGHQRVQQQTQRIDQDVSLLALDQLAGIEAMRVDAEPPFSALFTLWLSMMQAVGLASWPACSRHFT